MCCSSGHKNVPQTSHNFQNAEWGEDGLCTCPGTDGLRCCGYATQPDGKCDRCRIHCGDIASDAPDNERETADAVTEYDRVLDATA